MHAYMCVYQIYMYVFGRLEKARPTFIGLNPHHPHHHTLPKKTPPGTKSSSNDSGSGGLSVGEAAVVDASYLLQLACALLLMVAMLHAGWQVMRVFFFA